MIRLVLNGATLITASPHTRGDDPIS